MQLCAYLFPVEPDRRPWARVVFIQIYLCLVTALLLRNIPPCFTSPSTYRVVLEHYSQLLLNLLLRREGGLDAGEYLFLSLAVLSPNTNGFEAARGENISIMT